MVQREVEVKVLEVDRPAMERRLEALGARRIFDGILDIRSFRPSGEASLLRVRKEGEETFLVVKVPADGGIAKHTDEHSVRVDDFDAAVRLVEALGFPAKWSYAKHRTSYILDGVRFEFDRLLGEYDFVPEYLELEAPDERSLQRMLERLGIPLSDALPWTGGDVIRHYKK